MIQDLVAVAEPRRGGKSLRSCTHDRTCWEKGGAEYHKSAKI